MSGITLRQLEIFAQVVEHGSFRRCADHIGVSQVSISEHVRELESRLGASLFDRHSGGPSTLTPEGARAHRRVVAILADLNDLMWDVSGGRAGVSRRMGVAMHPFLMRYLGSPRRYSVGHERAAAALPAGPSVMLDHRDRPPGSRAWRLQAHPQSRRAGAENHAVIVFASPTSSELPISFRVGRSTSLTETATGKTFLAFKEKAAVTAALAARGYPRLGATALRELETIRKRGFARSDTIHLQ